MRKALKQLKKEVLLKDALALFPLVSLEELTSEIRRLKYSTNEASIIDVLIDLLKVIDYNEVMFTFLLA